MLRIRDSVWVPADRNVGSFVTSTRRGVWHTTEGSSIAGAESAYRSHGGWPHATWDPRSGVIHQHIEADESGASVMNQSGGVETNRYGALQIEVVAQAVHPFTDLEELPGLDRIMEWLRANGVHDHWPAGAPLPYPESYGFNNPQRNAHLWANTPGHYGHSQVPENDHGDPGAIDINRILSGGTQPAPPPPIQPQEDAMSVVFNQGNIHDFAINTNGACVEVYGVKPEEFKSRKVFPDGSCDTAFEPRVCKPVPSSEVFFVTAVAKEGGGRKRNFARWNGSAYDQVSLAEPA